MVLTTLIAPALKEINKKYQYAIKFVCEYGFYNENSGCFSIYPYRKQEADREVPGNEIKTFYFLIKRNLIKKAADIIKVQENLRRSKKQS